MDTCRHQNEPRYLGCPRCGAKVAEGTRLCDKCGISIHSPSLLLPKARPWVEPPSANGKTRRRWPTAKESFELFKTVFWEKYAVFRGRSRRAEFWSYWMFRGTFMSGIDRIGVMLADRTNILLLDWAGFVAFLVFLTPDIALSVRRMHDTGKSGWHCLIPIYGLARMMFVRGTVGPNRFGPDPKEEPLAAGDELGQE